MTLKTDYKDYTFQEGETLRKYQQISNDDGTISFRDVTSYQQEGDRFSASDINSTNAKVNELNQTVGVIQTDVSGLQTDVSTLKSKTSTIQTDVSELQNNTYTKTEVDTLVNGTLNLKNVFNGDITSSGTYAISDISNAKVLFVQTKDDVSGTQHIQCMPLFPTPSGSFITSQTQQYIVNNGARINFPSATQLVLDSINTGGHLYRIDMMY